MWRNSFVSGSLIFLAVGQAKTEALAGITVFVQKEDSPFLVGGWRLVVTIFVVGGGAWR